MTGPGPVPRRTVQSILYLPHFLSWVIIVAIFQHMLGATGLLNSFLTEHDLGSVNIIGNRGCSRSWWSRR